MSPPTTTDRNARVVAVAAARMTAPRFAAPLVVSLLLGGPLLAGAAPAPSPPPSANPPSENPPSENPPTANPPTSSPPAAPPPAASPPAASPPSASPPAKAPSPRASTPAPVASSAEPSPEPDGATTAELPADDAAASAPPTSESGETIEIVERAPAGAKSTIKREVLERAERDDLHAVLAGTAGVYVRDEDGYGLRPNIGMRGASADRSSKITLMEDGVLIAPAPYSAPAAYYVPLVTRLSRIDVIKGPSAIRFGPNTVGGAVDLISEPMPGARAGYVDLSVGSDRYAKLHARAAERRERWAVMAEYVRLRTDGFKELDGGGPTGFDKSDVQVTARVSSAPTASHYHQVELRFGYGSETSHETYTGLSDADFAAAPQRRYVASELDEMDWDHWRMRASHRLEIGARTRLDTVAYRHRFDRAWGKIDGFVGQRDFYGLIADPMSGANAVYYAILTGQADSSSPEETLILGTNDRRFTSQGVQSTLSLDRTTGELGHHVDAGLRLHFDRADRRRFEDGYDMVSRMLVRARPRERVLDSRADTLALAVFAEDTVRWRRLELSAGLRVEAIAYQFDNRLNQASQEASYAVVIPGGGAQYHVTDELTALAGVYRGFVPVAPSAAADIKPESSINYEAGARWQDGRVVASLLGFFSNYKNLKGSCSLASGCTEAQDGEEFNGGAVRVWGIEAQAGGELPLRGTLSLPIDAAYTLTRSAFQTTFSSEFAGWGDVEKGDQLPYLPTHQLSVSAAAKAPRWETGATVRWRAASRDVAGRGAIPTAVRADALLTIDLTGHLRLHEYAELYATVSNLLDEQVIVSRRPYGARPNPPRMIALGYKARF
jgi:Fe(3+) dicitrate transport protein